MPFLNEWFCNEIFTFLIRSNEQWLFKPPCEICLVHLGSWLRCEVWNFCKSCLTFKRIEVFIKYEFPFAHYLKWICKNKSLLLLSYNLWDNIFMSSDCCWSYNSICCDNVLWPASCVASPGFDFCCRYEFDGIHIPNQERLFSHWTWVSLPQITHYINKKLK